MGQGPEGTGLAPATALGIYPRRPQEVTKAEWVVPRILSYPDAESSRESRTSLLGHSKLVRHHARLPSLSHCEVPLFQDLKLPSNNSSAHTSETRNAIFNQRPRRHKDGKPSTQNSTPSTWDPATAPLEATPQLQRHTAH